MFAVEWLKLGVTVEREALGAHQPLMKNVPGAREGNAPHREPFLPLQNGG
jgi:hypothetical protein